MLKKVVKMKSKPKSGIMILITLGIIFALSATISSNLIFSAVNSDKGNDVINFDNKNLRSSAISGKILINGNAGWASFKAAGNCTGSGIFSDPYVIEDLEIDGTGPGSGIRIQNSDVYFRIENCTIYNVPQPDTGIWLYHVDNGNIVGNNLSFNWQGIILDPNCENNTIQGNIASNNAQIGINLWESNNNYVKENTVNNNGAMGINLEPDSSYNEIVNNTVNFNGWVGIRIAVNSTNNIIQWNNVNSNTNEGILLSESSNNYVKENTANSNGYRGIFLESNSENNTIQGNTANSNQLSGITLRESNNNYIKENTANSNSGSGGRGISLEANSSYNEVVNNAANFNEWTGIVLAENIMYNLVMSNNISNHNTGIHVEAPNNTISDNDIHTHWRGIFLAGNNQADSNNITRNYIHDNGVGIYLDDDSSYNIIEGNLIIDNAEKGLVIANHFSSNNLIFNNTFINNLIRHAEDDGTNNTWSKGTLGNYWDDYSGSDADDDGIGDTPYTIFGSADSQDNFPIWDDGPDPVIPGNNLFFLIGILASAISGGVVIVVAIVIIRRKRKRI